MAPNPHIPEKGTLDVNGHEVPDPTPMSIPSGFKRPPTLAEQVARLVRSNEFMASLGEAETFEESEDFEVGDDFDPNTPFEEFFDPSLGRHVTPAEILQNEQIYRRLADEYAARNAKPEDKPDLSPAKPVEPVHPKTEP